MKVANIDIEILHKFLNDLTNFSEIFRKDVTYDNIKSCKKTGFHPLFKTYIFQKIIEVKVTPPPFPPRHFKVKHELKAMFLNSCLNKL